MDSFGVLYTFFFLGRGGSYKVITKTEPALDTPGIDIIGHKGGEENR